jgi:xanthine/CO dehydrogenase XdhC/CoxF family maturation factor
MTATALAPMPVTTVRHAATPAKGPPISGAPRIRPALPRYYATRPAPGHRGARVGAEGPGWQDVALQLRLLLSRSTSLAIATVVGARGPVVRQPGTVLVLTEAGQTIGFNPAGPLDGAIRDLAAEALATGQDRLECLPIEADAAAYIGRSGQISLEVYAMRVDAADPAFGAMLRYLDSGMAAVVIIAPAARPDLPWSEPATSPAWPAAPACRRRSSRTHGPCSAAATRHLGPTALAVRKAARASASGCGPAHRHGPSPEPEPGRTASVRPAHTSAAGPPAATTAQRQLDAALQATECPIRRCAVCRRPPGRPGITRRTDTCAPY